MKFEHTQMRPDGGGTITVTAETAAEVVAVNDHFKVFGSTPAALLDLAQAAHAGAMTYGTGWPAKRPWYLVSSALDPAFTAPYRELLAKVTGFAGRPPDLDLTPHHPRRLCHTHHTSACGLFDGCYVFDVLVTAEEWNGMDAATNADKNAIDYVQEDLGWRPFEPEFIENRKGGYDRNPNYLKRHPPRPGTGAPWLWATLFDWWRNSHATDEHRDLLRAADRAKAAAGLEDADYQLRSRGRGPASLVSGGLYTSYEPVVFVKWEDFAKLGG